jgi:hypothetical protein
MNAFMRVVMARPIIVGLLVISFVATSFYVLRQETLGAICGLSQPQLPSSPASASNRQPKLHLVLPIDARAAKQSRNFCKVLLSALVHGYEPTVVNWHLEGERMWLHRMKISGMLFPCRISGLFTHYFITKVYTNTWQTSPRTLQSHQKTISCSR